MLKTFRTDLHIHTCLSPCAGIEMTPRRIIEESCRKNIDIIAITDHNSSENVPAAISASRERDITVIGGMEVTTSEEVHIIGLFPDYERLREFQESVNGGLPWKVRSMGDFEQVVVNERDEVLRFHERNLMGATDMSVEETVRSIHETGGVAIACHIDREVFSIITQLGFIPDSLPLDAVEISFQTSLDRACRAFDGYRKFTWIRSSDAHYVSDIGRICSEFVMKGPGFDELRLAFLGEGGRGVRI